MRRIIAVDPGLEDTGWAILEMDEKNNIVLKDFGLIKTAKQNGLSKRLKEIYYQIMDKISKFNVGSAAIEEAYFIDRIKTQSLTIHSRGVILLAFENMNIPYNEYNPRTVKKTITGNGNAKKNQMQSVIKMMFSIKDNIYPDIADAIAIGITDLRFSRFKERQII